MNKQYILICHSPVTADRPLGRLLARHLRIKYPPDIANNNQVNFYSKIQDIQMLTDSGTLNQSDHRKPAATGLNIRISPILINYLYFLYKINFFR
jgi:hypothetical protein